MEGISSINPSVLEVANTLHEQSTSVTVYIANYTANLLTRDGTHSQTGTKPATTHMGLEQTKSHGLIEVEDSSLAAIVYQGNASM